VDGGVDSLPTVTREKLLVTSVFGELYCFGNLPLLYWVFPESIALVFSVKNMKKKLSRLMMQQPNRSTLKRGLMV
jgi:hypothetical protein